MGQEKTTNACANAVLLSGGLDSTVALMMVIPHSDLVFPLYIKCGLAWENDELRAAKKICSWFDERLAPLVEIDLPVAAIYGDHWSLTGREAPSADSPDEAVFLPGRNLLLLTVAGLWCRQHGVPQLAIGVLDSNPFADAGEGFFTKLEDILNVYGPPEVRIIRPLAGMTKVEIIRYGQPARLETTFSCIAPIDGLHCGRCNKCAERRRAFREAGIRDRTPYVYK